MALRYAGDTGGKFLVMKTRLKSYIHVLHFDTLPHPLPNHCPSTQTVLLGIKVWLAEVT